MRANTVKDSTGFARVRDVGRLSPGGITHGHPLPAQPSQPPHAWRTKERGIEHDRNMASHSSILDGNEHLEVRNLLTSLVSFGGMSW